MDIAYTTATRMLIFIFDNAFFSAFGCQHIFGVDNQSQGKLMLTIFIMVLGAHIYNGLTAETRKPLGR